jgi:hypothetical protein
MLVTVFKKFSEESVLSHDLTIKKIHLLYLEKHKPEVFLLLNNAHAV